MSAERDRTLTAMADYATGLAWEDLSEPAIHSAKRSMLDSIGCALGALDAPHVQALHALAREVTAAHPATIVGTAIRTSAELAGFANGAMIRALDFSDDYFGGTGKQAGPHPSDNLGSLIAAAESKGASPRDLLLAAVIAYELCAQLVDRTALHPQGWDYTVLHSIATAAGAGRLMGLDAARMRHALSLAVVPNVSLWQTRLGKLSNWKNLAGPNGSRAGLFAALLASHGITGPDAPFEGKAGLMRQLQTPFELGGLGGRSGSYKIERTFYKSLPVMYSAQLPIELALELRTRAKHAQIESLVLYVYGYMLSTGAYSPERWTPTTPEMADHSSPYLIAAALVDGRIDEATMSAARYRDPTILGVASKLRVEEDPAYSALYPRALRCRLEARLVSGEVVAVERTNPKGHPDNPLNDRELEAKFSAQAEPRIGRSRSRRLIDLIWNLERAETVAALLAASRAEV